MKKLLFLLLFPVMVFSQGAVDSDKEVERVPVYPGCEALISNNALLKQCFQRKMEEHIRNEFRYPREAIKQGRQGVVEIQFVIDKSGYIRDIKTDGFHRDMRYEARRIIKRLPQPFIPAYVGKKRVSIPFSIPITFRLN